MEFFDATEDLEDGAVACGKFYHGNGWYKWQDNNLFYTHSFKTWQNSK